MDYGQTTVALEGNGAGEFVAGPTCVGPYGEITAAAVEPEIDQYAFAVSVRSTLANAGYDVARRGVLASSYYIDGSVAAANVAACRQNDFTVGDSQAVSGSADVTVVWTVRSSVTDEVAHVVQTVGRAEATEPVRPGVGALVRAGLDHAVLALGEDPEFRRLFYRRSEVPPPIGPGT